MEKEKNNIGLVLSGGGLRGIAHIGVIKLLEELNISPSYVSGTSAGALVSAFYAAGFSSKEIMEFFMHTKLFSLKNYAFRKPGVLDPMKFLPSLQKYFPENTFKVLTKKLFIVRTNLETGTGEIVHEGELLPSLLASAALPLMFAPVEIDGVLYADGGIVDNFSVKPLIPFCKHIIGVYVNPLEMKKKKELKNTFSVIERAFHISLAQHSLPEFSKCEVMILPEKLKYHSLLDVNHIQDIFEIGYQAALLHKERLAKTIALD